MSDNSSSVRTSGRHAVESENAIAAEPARAAEPADAAVALQHMDSPPLAGSEAARTPARRGDIDIAICEDLATVAHEWRDFETRAAFTPFQTYDWLAKWQKHIGVGRGTVPAIVLGRDSGGRLVFVLPLAVTCSGPVRRLTWLGSDLCDYNAPLIAEDLFERLDPDRFAALWRDIIGRLRADSRYRFDLADLQKMPELLGDHKNPFLQIDTSAHPSGAYIALLGNDWEAFYAAKRSGATRKRERRQLKHLAEHGEVAFLDVRERAEIEQTLSTLFAQKTRSFARMGVEDLFARPGYREFLRDVATDPAVRDLVHVSRLEVGGTVAAASLALQFRDTYALILSSYDDGELARFGPGRAHLHELLRHAIARGYRRFDFTVGDEPYKRDWSDIELRLVDHLAATTPLGHVVVAVTAGYRHAKRGIKQTPALWRTFSKARAFFGSFAFR